MSGKTALVLGATGQVGQKLLQELLMDSTFTRVGEFGRRVMPQDSIQIGKEKLEQKTIDFDNLDESALKEGKWDVIYIALGTTRAQAGSAAAFEKIDREYVLNAARAAKVNDPNHPQRLVYLSSLGADPKSMGLYPRSKGLTELALADLGYSDVIVLRPAVLTGAQRKDSRFLENLAIRLVTLRSSWATQYSAPIGIVARAMLAAGKFGSDGLPESVKAQAAKLGGNTPFTMLDNIGTRALAEQQ